MLLRFIIFLCKFLLIIASGTLQGVTTNNTAKPGCPTQCGNIIVPYPFGIGINCSFDHSFILYCNTSSKPPKLFLEETGIRIYNISETEFRAFTRISYSCYNGKGFEPEKTRISAIDLGQQGVFTLSGKNKFTVIGCDDFAFIGDRLSISSSLTSGCVGLCDKAHDVPRGQCSGIGCCQTSIPKGLSYYNATPESFFGHEKVFSFNRCGYSFLVEEDSFKFGGASDLSAKYTKFVERIESTMPVVFDWVVEPNKTCVAEVNSCKGNSSCHDVDGGGYHCKCDKGYEGNPYLHPGCKGS